MVKECLPIRCLEASFLAVYITQELREVDRIPLSFKTEFRGEIHRCLVVHWSVPGVGWRLNPAPFLM